MLAHGLGEAPVGARACEDAERELRLGEKGLVRRDAQVLLRGGATVDARPSDAINLAAATGAPVYVADELLGVPADAGRPAS